jgi:hypothetical protein
MNALRRATRRNGGQEPSAAMLGASLRYVRAKVGRAVMNHLAWQACSAFLNSAFNSPSAAAHVGAALQAAQRPLAGRSVRASAGVACSSVVRGWCWL